MAQITARTWDLRSHGTMHLIAWVLARNSAVYGACFLSFSIQNIVYFYLYLYLLLFNSEFLQFTNQERFLSVRKCACIQEHFLKHQKHDKIIFLLYERIKNFRFSNIGCRLRLIQKLEQQLSEMDEIFNSSTQNLLNSAITKSQACHNHHIGVIQSNNIKFFSCQHEHFFFSTKCICLSLCYFKSVCSVVLVSLRLTHAKIFRKVSNTTQKNRIITIT